MLHRLTGVLGANVAVLFAAPDEIGGLISRPGDRPVIVTDRLRMGKGIRLEHLIPYSHSYLLQGNIHHIDSGGQSDGNTVHSGEEVGYVIEGEIELTVDRRTYRVRKEVPRSIRATAWVSQCWVEAGAHNLDQYSADFLNGPSRR